MVVVDLWLCEHCSFFCLGWVDLEVPPPSVNVRPITEPIVILQSHDSVNMRKCIQITGK